MRTLGLDPSFTSFGWAVIEDEKLLACGTIKTTPKDGGLAARVKKIRLELVKIIKVSGAEYAAVEDVFINPRNMKTSTNLARLSGAVIDRLTDHFDVKKIRLYAPSSIKKAICGHGAAEKSEVIKMAALQIGYKGKSDDEADAGAAALGCEREVKYERRISKDVDEMMLFKE